MTVKFTTVPSKRLAETINGSAYSFSLQDIKGWSGSNLTSADFGTDLYASFRNSLGTKLELMKIDPTTIASASITILKRGLGFDGDQTTEVTANIQDVWVKGDTIVELGSHVSQLLEETVRKSGDQTIGGIKTFTLSPSIPLIPTTNDQAASKAYADSLSYAGAPDASTTAKGLGRTSVSPNAPSVALTSISNASPAVFTLVSHGLTLNDSVQFTTSGSLPTGLSLATTYYVISAGLTANTFRVSATLGGTAINTSSAGSGTHSFTKTTPVMIVDQDPRLLTQAENDAAAGNSGSPSGSNRFLTENYIPSIRLDVVGQFGAGADGACNFDGTNTFSFASKAGSIYTLTGDVDATTIVVAVGVTINTANYIFNANTSITNNGTIQNNGNAGTVGAINNGTIGAGGAGGTATAAGTLGANIAGSAGGAGGPDSGIGVAGTNGTAQTSVGSDGVAGGASGTSSGTQGAASTGGTNTSETITVDLAAPITPSTLTAGSVTTVERINRISPKTSTNGYSLSTSAGSGGGAGGPSRGGGGGGAGATGGVLVISSPTITNSATGIIKSVGGNGGNGGDGIGASGGSGRLSGAGGGGGGGGNGGTIVLIYKTLTNSGSITAPGGTGGTGGQPGPNSAGYGVGTAGASGTNGASGKIYSAAITG